MELGGVKFFSLFRQDLNGDEKYLDHVDTILNNLFHIHDDDDRNPQESCDHFKTTINLPKIHDNSEYQYLSDEHKLTARAPSHSIQEYDSIIIGNFTFYLPFSPYFRGAISLDFCSDFSNKMIFQS